MLSLNLILIQELLNVLNVCMRQIAKNPVQLRCAPMGWGENSYYLDLIALVILLDASYR